MLKKFSCLLLLTCAATIPPPAALKAQQVAPTNITEGTCDVEVPIPGDWDVWYEITAVKGNGLFPTHVHDGIECVTTIKGTGFWWIAEKGGTTMKVPTNETLLVPDLTVHTGGNTDGGEMHYLSTHVMRAGAPFRDICTALGAPTSMIVNVASSNPFKVIFRNQKVTERPFKVKQDVKTLPSGASDTVLNETGPSYIAAIEGPLTLKSSGDTRTLQPGEGFLLAAGVTEMVGNAGEAPARMAVLQISELE
jgi:quercetin dioxygenase-like cupin family protein